jgi:hypothetical protein
VIPVYVSDADVDFDQTEPLLPIFKPPCEWGVWAPPELPVNPRQAEETEQPRERRASDFSGVFGPQRTIGLPPALENPL